MRVAAAIIGGLLVATVVAMVLLFFAGNALEGLPRVARYAALAGCGVIGMLAGLGSARASLARSRNP